jgi:hypothetical protein
MLLGGKVRDKLAKEKEFGILALEELLESNFS